MKFANASYGFEWGAAALTRLFSDKKKGWVVIGIKTSKEDLQIYITKTAKIRVYSNSGEWKEMIK